MIFKITDDQIARFITHSNAIEEIYYDQGEYEDALRDGKHGIPEIDGHVKAFREMQNWMLSENFDTIQINHICKLHTTLMTNVLDPWFLGLRREHVRVGYHLCPPPIALKPMLEVWCNKVNKLQDPTEDEVFQTHLAFEHIHPFIDGNGRTGRLLWLWLRLKHGLGFDYIPQQTKHADYYPKFDTFSWDDWSDLK